MCTTIVCTYVVVGVGTTAGWGSFGVVGDLQNRFEVARHVIVRMSLSVLVQQPVGSPLVS